MLSTFPAIQHRLKDLLDVVVMSGSLDLDGDGLVGSLRATLARRGTRPDPRVLDDTRTELKGRRWQTDGATMLRDKAVAEPLELEEAIAKLPGDCVSPTTRAALPGHLATASAPLASRCT